MYNRENKSMTSYRNIILLFFFTLPPTPDPAVVPWSTSTSPPTLHATCQGLLLSMLAGFFFKFQVSPRPHLQHSQADLITFQISLSVNVQTQSHTPSLLQYGVAISSFLSSVFPCCHSIHHLHLPFPLCSPLTLFAIQFSNRFSSLSPYLFSWRTLISQGDYSSPCSPITHPSMTFQHVPRLGPCSDYDSINTVSSCMYSLKLDLRSAVLQSSLTYLLVPLSIRASLASTTLRLQEYILPQTTLIKIFARWLSSLCLHPEGCQSLCEYRPSR